MFNGYNDTPLISYEFSQERVEKKHENVPKWNSYGHEAGVQPPQTQPNNRHPEFWAGKPNFLGIPNVVKCNCTGCYPSSEKQSYQGDTTRHRPWLPRTYPVPVNGSNEPCKLPACQWDNVLSNQGSCYPDGGLPYGQENGGKYTYYKHHQNSRLAESNQPGVITSVKNAEYGKKSKGDLPPRGQESPAQNGNRQPVFCNPAYGLAKRVDGRNYCDAIEKYSNVAPYSVDQHIPRLPVVEPFAKAVPSNLSQSRVPSTGYRSVKENMPQPYTDLGYGDARKICPEDMSCEQRSEAFSTGQLQATVHADYSHFNPEVEPQKLFFDNARHSDYYSRNNFQEVIKRDSQPVDSRKDCAMHQINEIIMSEQHYNLSRSKHQEIGVAKPSCDAFYTKDFEKARPENHLPANSACFQRSDDAKNENTNVHSRLPPSALLFNDPRFADRTQNSLTCQSNPVAYRNYIRPEYPYQGYNTQPRYEYPGGLQRNDLGQFRAAPQQIQSCEQLPPQQGTGFLYDPHYQLNPDKTQHLYRAKNPSPIQPESQVVENRNPTYVEAIRSEELNKNGTSKISPLRLLRKKKFINVPQEPTPASTLDAVPGLDVRKFWSTWAEEEEENVAPTQMVVLDCQNIDPEQAKLLHLYETDPVRSIQLDASSTVIKNTDFVKEPVDQAVEEVKTCEQVVCEPKVEEKATAKNETEVIQEETEKAEESNPVSASEPESKAETVESAPQKTSDKPLKRGKSVQESRGKKKTEIMDKWTEKKFDFLKRAEESKAAEILRHEEEKKKIFETRLSLQQTAKKCEKPQEKMKNGDEGVPERHSPFDENSRSESPEDLNGNAGHLPTCEYRRNKFLDYSEQKVLVNGDDKMGKSETENAIAAFGEPVYQVCEIKKEENGKLDLSEKWENDELCPPLHSKCAEGTAVEMDDILKKMSEINFQKPKVKLENGLEQNGMKKLKTGRKVRKRKSDHQPEADERTDKLTVETVTKPTIKFSIQKSHDLKISFKVLNSSKEYSDEDAGGEGVEDEGKADENSKNSTELITLKYKSIKRDGDRRQISDLKKSRRRKKQTPKTPVLKIKKSRYMPQEERDPLADDDGDALDKCSSADGFQVKETMDSAKIKLTFKRHKGNFETEYKINSNNIEKVLEGDSMEENGGEEEEDEEEEEEAEMNAERCSKKSRKGRKDEIFAEAGVENFQSYPGATSDVENCSPTETPHFESPHEDSGNSSTSRDSDVEEENCDFHGGSFSELPPEPPTPGNGSDEGRFPEELENGDPSDSKWSEEGNKPEESLLVFSPCHVTDSYQNNTSEGKPDELPQLGSNPCPDVELKLLTPDEAVSTVGGGDEKATNFEQEEIQEISLDFIRSTKSQEIESNHNSGKTVESETVNGENDAEALKEKHLGSPDGITISETEASSCTLKPEEGEMTCAESRIADNDVMSPICDSHEIPGLPSLDLEDECVVKNPTTVEEHEGVRNEEETDETLVQETTEPLDERETRGNHDFPKESHVISPDGDSSSENVDHSVGKAFSPLPEISHECIHSPEFIHHSSESLEATGNENGPMSREPETDCPTNFDLLMEKSADHPNENIFECEYLSPEAVVENASSSLFENPNFLPSQDELEMPPGKNTAERGKDDCLPAEDSACDCLEMTIQTWETQFESEAGLPDCRPCTGNSPSPEAASQDANNISVDVPEMEEHVKEDTGDNEEELKRPKLAVENSENVLASPKPNELEQSVPEHLSDNSGISECAFSGDKATAATDKAEEDNEMLIDKISQSDVNLSCDMELEEGEIVDDSPVENEDESAFCHSAQSRDIFPKLRTTVDFVARKIERRHSVNVEKSTGRTSPQSWSKRKFSKAKSCPPKVAFTEPELPKPETPLYIPVEDIPLPLGPAPYGSCFDFAKYLNLNKTKSEVLSPDTKEKSKEPSSLEQQQLKETVKGTPLRQSTSRPSVDPTPPLVEGLPNLQRSSKIKFSFLKRSKFSKIGLKHFEDLKTEVPTQARDGKTEEPEKPKDGLPDFQLNKETEPPERSSSPTECQIVEVPKPNVPEEVNEAQNCQSEDVGLRNDADTIGLSCEDLGESVEVISTMNDFIRDEFYECEDIPTSEDLTNGEDPEIEKVNDDKFRNIMQNCLDNAKKFLNVGNLKLFSCSVDDLLELDCQEGSESSLGDNEAEKPANHISRDVLLTSCEDTTDDLGLSQNIHTTDISMDFIPSFCSDVCPEILPVDNWPYLEEEVPSSPTKSKQDDADLIPSLEGGAPYINGGPYIERRRRKRVSSESSFKRFRRKVLSDGEALKVCSKIGSHRRKTVDSFTSYGRDIRDIKDDLIRLKNEVGENKSLKCRLSLDKITNQQGLKSERMSKDSEKGGRVRSLDYRSPSWQPKVMLFRISKHELRKVLKSSKSHKRFASKSSDDSTKRKISCDLGNQVGYAIKKRKPDQEMEKLYVKPVQEFEEKESPKEERLIDLSKLDSIKGSLTSADPEARKRKKLRFRNLHTKRKPEADTTKDTNSSARSTSPAEATLVDAETTFAEIFQDCDRVPNSQVKNMQLISIKEDDHKSKKKSLSEHSTCDSRVHTSSKNERRPQSEIETTRSQGKSKEEGTHRHDRHRERTHDHRDRRREKSEGRDHCKHDDRHRDSENKKHDRRNSGHDSSKRQAKGSPCGSRHSKTEPEMKSSERSMSERGEKKRSQEATAEAPWVCEVCGFSDPAERVGHIKSHPFHCQSCHLAFKTEAHFIRHLTKKHKDIRNQHHCLLCELSFDREDQYQRHLETREHRHLESVEKNTINTLFTLLTGAPCPVFGLLEMRPEWLPNQAGTVHFYHQATPLSLALQYLKMHHDLSSFSTSSSAQPN